MNNIRYFIAFFIVVIVLNTGCSNKHSNPPSTTNTPTNQTNTLTKPSAPSDLQAYAGNGSVTLTFSPSTGATGYNVYESSLSGGPYNRVDTTANAYYTVQGLQKGPTYYFVVTAGNDAGESGYSNEASSVSYIITRLYGVGTYPVDIAMDASGNLWVANYGSDDVTELTPSGSVVGTYSAGNGPIAIAIDPSGNVWVVNQKSNTVTELGPNGSRTGDYPTGQKPDALAIDLMGNVWIANSDDNTVTVLSPSGTTIGTYPAGDMPAAIAVDSSYDIWIADWSSDTLSQLNRNGSLISTYTSGGMPSCIRLDPSGNMWVTNWWDGTVTKLALDGSTIGTYSTGNRPHGIAIDSSGNIYVTNNYGNTVSVLTSAGITIGTYPAGSGPAGIVIDTQGNVWVTNQTDGSLTELLGIAKGTGAVTGTKPSPPANLTASVSSSQATLNWSASGSAGSYNVYESTVSGGPYTMLGSTSSTSYGVTNLSKGTAYYFVVTAVNASAESWYSNEVKVIIYLSSPTGLSATSADREVTLLWNGVLGASGYNVYTSTTTGGTYTKVGATGALHFTITGLITGTTYYLAVAAFNSAGESAKSAAVSATPEYPTTVPSPPAGLAAVVV
ncbi:MAG: fibronectin type III domain-containing protein, partial [Deltaproteobacteria bacterium]|nr:fibronectin type III domain-containing protein [Deltaproteobacteria bacterium]